MTFRKSIFAVSLPDTVVLDVSAQQRHLQHCLFIEALGHLGLGNVSACQQRMQQLLQINPAHDKAHLIRHALQSGIFPEPQWAGSARLNPTVPCVSLYRGIIMNNAQTHLKMGYVWTICLVAACGGLLFGYDWVVIGGAKPFYGFGFQLRTRRSPAGR